MADKNTETKVVQVRFDNSKFSKNIKTATKQLEEFDKKLQFKSNKKNIKEITDALEKIDVKEANKELNKTEGIVHKITVDLKELVKIKLLSKALDVVINKSSALIKNMTGINNVLAGWRQYEIQMTNVGGILNQVEAKNKGLSDVADAMDRLRWYTDETSFSFTTLSDGIRQFVVAGIDLNQAAEAAMGVTNLAGSAKVFDKYKVQSAMDAVSKSMQTGYMDVMKWTSLTNTAGIVTEDFTKMLLQEAAAQGKLVESSKGQYKTRKSGKLVTPENIRSTLSDKWLNSEVLTNVMNRYASASSTVEKFSGLMEEQTGEALNEINEMFKNSGVQFSSFEELLSKLPEDVKDSTNMTARQTGKFLEQLGYQFDEVSYKAFKSSQETTSFAQSVESVQAAISTKWSKIFESIFGNYDRATELWSDVSDKFYDIFVVPFDTLSGVFDRWSTLTEGGAEDFRKTLLTIIDVVEKFKNAVLDGFKAVFGEFNETTLQKITIVLKRFFDNLERNEGIFKVITAIAKIFASVLKIIGKVGGAVLKIVVKLLSSLEPVFDLLADIIDKIADGIVWFVDLIDDLGIIDGLVRSISKVLEFLAKGIKKVVDWLKGKVDMQKVLKGIGDALDWIKTRIEWLIDLIKQATEAIKTWWEESKLAQGVADAYSKSVEGVKKAFSGFKDSTDEATKGLDEVSSAGEKATKKMSWMDSIKNAFLTLAAFMKTVGTKVYTFLNDSGIIQVVKQILDPLITLFINWFKQLKELAKDDPKEALEMIKKAVLAVLSIVLIIHTIGLIRSASSGLWEIYGALKAFKRKMIAEKWKALSVAVLLLSASILVLTYAIKNLTELGASAKRVWMAVGVIGAIVIAYAGILALMNYSKGSVRAGISSIGVLISTSIALSIFLHTFKKIVKETSGMSNEEVWKAIGILGSLIGMWAVVLFTTFRKVETKWLIAKSGKMVGPGLFALGKTLLGIWAFMKIAFWFADKVLGYNDEDIKKAGKIFGAVISTLIGVYITFNVLSRVVSGKRPATYGKGLVVDLSSILLIVIAAFYLFKYGSKLEYKEIWKGFLSILGIFSAIGALCLAMALSVRIISEKNPTAMALKFTSGFNAIMWSVLAGVVGIKMLGNISEDQIKNAAEKIIKLYLIIGLISAALNITSRAVERSISKTEITTKKYKSPIGSALFAISLSVLMMVGAIKLVNLIDPKEFKEGYAKIKMMLEYLTLITIAILIASRKTDGKGVGIAIGSLAATVVLILVLAKVLTLKDTKGNDIFTREDLNRAGIVFTMVAGLITTYMAILGVINRFLPTTIKSASSVAILMGTLIISVYAILGAIAILERLSEDDNYVAAVVSISAMFLALVGSIAIMVFAFNKLNSVVQIDIKTALSIAIMVGAMIGAMYSIIGAIAILQNISPGRVVGGVFAVISLLGAISTVVFLYMKFVKGIKQHKTFRKDTISVIMLIGAITGSVVAFAHAIYLLRDLTVGKMWAGVAIILACSTIISAIVYGYVELIKRFSKHDALKKDTPKMMMAIGIMVAAIGVMVHLIMVTSKINVTKLWAGMAIISVIVIVVSGFIVGMTALSKFIKDDPNLTKNILKMMMAIGVMVAAISAIIFGISVIANIPWQKAWLGMGIVAVIITALIIVLAIINKLAIAMMANAVTFPMMAAYALLMAVVSAAVVGIAYAITLISEVDETRVNKSTHIIGVIMMSLAAFMLFAKILGKNAHGLGGIALASLLFVSAAIGIALIAQSIIALSKIGDDDLKKAVKYLQVILTTVTTMALIFGVLSSISAGGGALAAVIFVAIGYSLKLVAEAMDIASMAANKLADAFAKFVASIIFLGKNLTWDMIKRIAALGAAMLALTAGQLVSAIGGFVSSIFNFGAALVDLGTSIAKFFGSIADLGTEAVNTLKSVFIAIQDFISAAGEKKKTEAVADQAEAYDKLANAYEKIEDVNLGKIKSNINNLNSIFKDQDTDGIDDFRDSISGVLRSIDQLSYLNTGWIEKKISSIFKILDKTEYDKLTFAAIILDDLRAILEDFGENPTIKPILDLSNFNSGMEEIRKGLGEYGFNYNSQMAAISYSNSKGKLFYRDSFGYNKNGQSSNTIVVNQYYELNDPLTQGYDVQRMTKNSVINALRFTK